MARNVDLSLDSFLIAGLSNFINEFGTKKQNGQGLSTEEISNLDMLIYRQQQAIIVDETIDCTQKQVQSDRRFIFTIPNVQVKLSKSNFQGIKLTFLADFQNGTSSIVYKNKDDQNETLEITSGQVIELYADKDGYFKQFNIAEQNQAIGD